MGPSTAGAKPDLVGRSSSDRSLLATSWAVAVADIVRMLARVAQRHANSEVPPAGRSDRQRALPQGHPSAWSARSGTARVKVPRSPFGRRSSERGCRHTESECQPSPSRLKCPLEPMPYSIHSVGEHRFGHGTRRTQAGRHSRCGCGGIQPAHGYRRGGDARAAKGASPRSDRSEDQGASRAHSKEHRRRHAGGIFKRR